ncbi:MAG: hypothetical protein M1365_11990 [Actinobacteria bacterium]|nr:hypothetical protein [Actinomycetota bacterium]
MGYFYINDKTNSMDINSADHIARREDLIKTQQQLEQIIVDLNATLQNTKIREAALSAQLNSAKNGSSGSVNQSPSPTPSPAPTPPPVSSPTPVTRAS